MGLLPVAAAELSHAGVSLAGRGPQLACEFIVSHRSCVCKGALVVPTVSDWPEQADLGCQRLHMSNVWRSGEAT